MTKPAVSIGITAYNEEKTIRALLVSLLKQKETNYHLKEIVVVLDGCTDQTEKEVLKVKSKKIRLITDRKRKGKNARLNQLFKIMKGSMFILLDADVSLTSTTVIEEMVNGFTRTDSAGMVGAKVFPFEGNSFLERAIFSSVEAYVKYAESVNSGNNVYTCKGAAIGLSEQLAKKVTIPKEVFADDTYLYLSCLKLRYKYTYAGGALVRYNLPKTLGEHLSQNTRFESADESMVPIFGKLVDQEFKKERDLFYWVLMWQFIRKPVLSLAIIFINLYCKLLAKISARKISVRWSIAKTTKQIYSKRSF